MKFLTRLTILAAAVLFIPSCATSRSAFSPESGPPTVGMPAELSGRERSFIPQVETALRNQGYLPVRHGAGDMQLQFEMAEGPINTDTKIELYAGRQLLARGFGRGAGAPMIGRGNVAGKSFDRAFQEFQSSLSGVRTDATGGPAPSGELEYVY